MYTFFLTCFGVGLCLTVIFFLLGGVLDLLDVDFDFDFDFLNVSICIPSPMLILLFLTTFGGSGALFYRLFYGLHTIVIVIVSSLIGFAISYFLYAVLIKPLKKAQNTSIPEEEELIGLSANVSETIKKGGFGEITYSIHGNTYCSPAKAVNGEQIDKDSDVAICWVKDYVYYVVRVNQGGKEE